jgi:predicted enzyme involved in methoxymalonyl-ACP biosynthesis
VGDARYASFSVRLKDRFGDHGLIAVVIGHVQGTTLEVDTWLMSCRVLKRQVEEEVVNEMVRLARLGGCATVKGVFLRTPKNDMVANLYPGMGFSITADCPDRREFELEVAGYDPKPTKIRVIRTDYEPERCNREIAGHL